jgi:hypothetical protein
VNQCAAANTSMHMYGYNQKFYSPNVFSDCTNKKESYISDNTTEEGHSLSVNVLCNMFDNTTSQRQQLSVTLLHVQH